MNRRIALLVAALTAAACRAPVNANAPIPVPTRAIRTTREGPWMGTAHPLTVQGASERYRWLAACQARQDTNGDGNIYVFLGRHGDTGGDQLLPYFMFEEGPGEPIDKYIGSSPSGRFVAFAQNQRVFVFDAQTKVRHDLSEWATPSSDGETLSQDDQSVAFSRGHRLAFVQRRGSHFQVVLVDLETNESKIVYDSSVLVWRARFAADGRSLWILEIPSDTDNNHKIEPPTPITTLAHGGCRGAPMSYSNYGWVGDRPEKKAIALDEPENVDAQERLVWAGGCLPNGAQTVLETGTGEYLVSAIRTGSYEPDFGPVRWLATPEKTSRCFRMPHEPQLEADPAGARSAPVAPSHAWDVTKRKMEFAVLSGAGIQSVPVATLNRELIANGFSSVSHNEPSFNVVINVGWRRLRLGIVGGAAGVQPSYGPRNGRLDVLWGEGGPYVGFDILRTRRFTTFVQAEYRFGEVGLEYKDVAPPFATVDGSEHSVRRIYSGLGIAVGHDFYLPFLDWEHERSTFALLLGARLSHFLQLCQGDVWRVELQSGDGGAPLPGGPPVNATGLRFELHAGFSVYDY